MKTPQGKLAAVSTGEELDAKKHYDNWADTYDKDLIEDYGYNAHIQVAKQLTELTRNYEVEIVDLGCGTGLLGKELLKLGFESIDGVDFSQGMLDKAKELHVYRALYCEDLTKRCSISDDRYDVAVSSGLFGAGHLSAIDLSEMIRLVKPQGFIVILMNALPYETENFAQHIRLLEDQQLWQVTSNTEVNYMDQLDRPGRLIVAKAL